MSSDTALMKSSPVTYLGPKGYTIKKDSITVAEQNSIKKELMVKPFVPPNSIQQAQEFPLYRESGKKLYVPRFYGRERYGEPQCETIGEGEDIDVTFAGGLRDYQETIISAYMKEAEKSGCGLLEIPCGRGKCLGWNTPVLMADHTIKMVQDVCEGDLVMGDDFTPRFVSGITRGMSKMYRVCQSNGMDYEVNDVHILTLYDTVLHEYKDIAIEKFLRRYYYDEPERFMGIRHISQNETILSKIEIVLVPGKKMYYGFELDRNRRFLLGDHTVTHNTVMALNIITRLAKKTLVIVHKEFLMNQWIERIEQFIPDAKVGKIQGKVIDVEGKDIVIGMLQSLSMKEYPAGTFSDFGLTISDECFVPETLILTNKGYFSIETLYEMWSEDKDTNKLPLIYSYNHSTRQTEYKELEYAWKKPSGEEKSLVDVEFSHTTITCTANHKFYTIQRGYIEAAKLINEEDIIMIRYCPDRGYISDVTKVYSVRTSRRRVPFVYDIEVRDNHNYVVCDPEYDTMPHGILVHNCHHISAEVFCRSLFKIVTPYMLGLSATMNRKDGLTKVFKLFLGNVAYKEERNTDDAVTVRAIQYEHPDPEFSETLYNFKGQTHYALMIRKLCEFNHRSEFILTVLKDMLKENPDQQVMILAHNKSLLKYLHDAIEHRDIATVGYYVGGMKEAALKETENKQVVIATYAMAEEALDIKTLASLILATPKTDVTQAVGRILRMKHEHPIVVDIVDQHDVFQKQFVKRRRFYMKCKYKIMTTTERKYHAAQWETLYEPGAKAKKYVRKIAVKEKAKNLQGKCFLSFDAGKERITAPGEAK